MGRPKSPPVGYTPAGSESAAEAEELCRDGVLTLSQARRFVGLQKTAFGLLVSRGAVKTFRVGGRRVVPKRGLVRFLAARLAEELEGER